MFLIPKNCRGDTIIEVLIAIAIVSLTLAGGYTSANRSANATRTAQERGEALKWAETQVEQIRAYPTDLSPYSQFCFTTAFAFQNGGTCLTSGPVPYKAKITQSPSGTFSVLVTWNSIGVSSAVNAVNSVELDYVK